MHFHTLYITHSYPSEDSACRHEIDNVNQDVVNRKHSFHFATDAYIVLFVEFIIIICFHFIYVMCKFRNRDWPVLFFVDVF